MFFYKVLDDNLGTVFSSILDFLSIERNSSSPYLYEIKQDSIILNATIWEQLGDIISTDCSYIIQSLDADLPLLVTVNSTVGSGFILDRLIK